MSTSRSASCRLDHILLESGLHAKLAHPERHYPVFPYQLAEAVQSLREILERTNLHRPCGNSLSFARLFWLWLTIRLGRRSGRAVLPTEGKFVEKLMQIDRSLEYRKPLVKLELLNATRVQEFLE